MSGSSAAAGGGAGSRATLTLAEWRALPAGPSKDARWNELTSFHQLLSLGPSEKQAVIAHKMREDAFDMETYLELFSSEELEELVAHFGLMGEGGSDSQKRTSIRTHFNKQLKRQEKEEKKQEKEQAKRDRRQEREQEAPSSQEHSSAEQSEAEEAYEPKKTRRQKLPSKSGASSASAGHRGAGHRGVSSSEEPRIRVSSSDTGVVLPPPSSRARSASGLAAALSALSALPNTLHRRSGEGTGDASAPALSPRRRQSPRRRGRKEESEEEEEEEGKEEEEEEEEEEEDDYPELKDSDEEVEHLGSGYGDEEAEARRRLSSRLAASNSCFKLPRGIAPSSLRPSAPSRARSPLTHRSLRVPPALIPFTSFTVDFLQRATADGRDQDTILHIFRQRLNDYKSARTQHEMLAWARMLDAALAQDWAKVMDIGCRRLAALQVYEDTGSWSIANRIQGYMPGNAYISERELVRAAKAELVSERVKAQMGRHYYDGDSRRDYSFSRSYARPGGASSSRRSLDDRGPSPSRPYSSSESAQPGAGGASSNRSDSNKKTRKNESYKRPGSNKK